MLAFKQVERKKNKAFLPFGKSILYLPIETQRSSIKKRAYSVLETTLCISTQTVNVLTTF